MPDMQQAIKELQETVVVMSGIQARQAEVLRGYGEWLAAHTAAMIRHDQMMARHDQIMAEIDDKLNGLIGYIDGQQHRKSE